jgi:hypothetical protein
MAWLPLLAASTVEILGDPVAWLRLAYIAMIIVAVARLRLVKGSASASVRLATGFAQQAIMIILEEVCGWLQIAAIELHLQPISCNLSTHGCTKRRNHEIGGLQAGSYRQARRNDRRLLRFYS